MQLYCLYMNYTSYICVMPGYMHYTYKFIERQRSASGGRTKVQTRETGHNSRKLGTNPDDRLRVVTTRAEDARGTRTRSHISPSILVYGDKAGKPGTQPGNWVHNREAGYKPGKPLLLLPQISSSRRIRMIGS